METAGVYAIAEAAVAQVKYLETVLAAGEDEPALALELYMQCWRPQFSVALDISS
eukprot:COSAG05_NODE_2946_length_2477_cov_1.764508_2_plen_55_part_00